MFDEVGRAYVYFTYGMHYCINVVAKDDCTEAGAVLFRALHPTHGIEFMMKNRKINEVSNLANGPAKIAQALQITKEQYGEDLTKESGLYIIEGSKIFDQQIEARPRVGIKKATGKLWNFRISQNGFTK
jgi:DNA-3-methyladenine glycosylase